MAATLVEAAEDSFVDINNLWIATTLKAQLTLFTAVTNPIFGQGEQNSRPASNWITILSVVADRMPSSNVPYSDMFNAGNYMYRCCYMVNQLDTQGLITGAQAAAVLAAYNTYIA